MTNFVTNVKVADVEGNLHRSSVQMSHVFSTTASSAGHLSTADLVENSTSPLLRKVQIVPELCLLDGARNHRHRSIEIKRMLKKLAYI